MPSHLAVVGGHCGVAELAVGLQVRAGPSSPGCAAQTRQEGCDGCEDGLDQDCEDGLDQDCEDGLDQDCEDGLDQDCEDGLDQDCDDEDGVGVQQDCCEGCGTEGGWLGSGGVCDGVGVTGIASSTETIGPEVDRGNVKFDL